ncbi:hypothetical protein FB451DRAFT_268202 [Mycena latifolia]|nr:hypothetical protein FB451DRAFT_268202 [Mycena latifolia]
MDVDRQAVSPRVKEEPDLTLPLHLRIKQRPVSLSDLETYPNPFELPKYRNLYNVAGAIIITGLPGIGKTRFLGLLFHLRVAAGLPTLYMSEDRGAMVYKNGQLGEILNPSTIRLIQNLSPDTWCLVDSNVSFPTVPGVVQQSSRFIVHASSPGANRLKYATKIEGRSQFCLMKPWTLSELIMGSSLQPFAAPLSEQKIEAFYKKFGGSARNVFKDGGDPDAFERAIDTAAARMNAADIERALLSDITTLTVPDHVHMLLSAFPVTDDDRRQYQIRSPSAAMSAKVLKRLNASARLRLYRICVGVKTAGCRAWTAHLFDQHCYDFLLMGGTWPLHAIEKPAGTRQESGSFLRADKEMSIAATGDQPQQPATVTSITFDKDRELGVGQSLLLGVYYRPTPKSIATFDGFYLDKPGHALAFQASLAQEHDVNAEGLDWFVARGITKITYIYVTPANLEGCPSLKVPVARENMFDKIYHMRL